MAVDAPIDEAHALAEPIAEPAARTGVVQKMFRYSAYLDVGEGAQECEHARDGECDDIEHFHAWCRLPTPYQQQDIRDKALAAKARRVRLLADPESDESIVLDQELHGLRDPIFASNLVEEVIKRDQIDDFLEAQRDLAEREEFAHIVQDREELGRLDRDTPAGTEEDQRSAEHRALAEHLRDYYEKLTVRMEEIREPRRVELRARSTDELVDLVRSRRVEAEGDRAFTEEFNAWLWFAGTYHVETHATCKRPYRLMWDELGSRDRPAVGTMRGEPPEVLVALQQTYDELRVAFQQGSAGN